MTRHFDTRENLVADCLVQKLEDSESLRLSRWISNLLYQRLPDFRRAGISSLVLLLVSLACIGGCDEGPLPRAEKSVSMVNLLLHPELRDRNKRVSVQGFLHLEGDDCCLYLNRDMAGSRIRTNAIALSLNRRLLRVYAEPYYAASRPLRDVQDKQVEVEGLWDEPTHLSDVTSIVQRRHFKESEKTWQAVAIPKDLAQKIRAKRVSPVCILSEPERYVGQEVCLDGRYVGDSPEMIAHWSDLPTAPRIPQSFLYFDTDDCTDNVESSLQVDLEESRPRFFLPTKCSEKQAGKRQIYGQWITVCGVLKSGSEEGRHWYYLGDVTEVVAPPVMLNAQ
ncbi:MAG: hypothetical protein U0105_10260 [Candidatus Obscuribacterales bacterium]